VGFVGIGRLLSVALAVGVFGGLAAIVTELFSVICGTQFSLSTPVWMAIGLTITVAYVLVNLSIIRLPRFASVMGKLGGDDAHEAGTDALSDVENW